MCKNVEIGATVVTTASLLTVLSSARMETIPRVKGINLQEIFNHKGYKGNKYRHYEFHLKFNIQGVILTEY